MADEPTTKLNDITNQVIYQLLLQDVNTFDILQLKVTLDGKNNMNGLQLSSDDQKYLLLELMKEKVIVKK